MSQSAECNDPGQRHQYWRTSVISVADSLTQVYFKGNAPGVGPTSFQNSRPIGPNGGCSIFYVATA